MKKEINKGLMTRKGYRIRKKATDILKEVKKTTITLFIGFFAGLLYYYFLIDESFVDAEEKPEEVIKEEVKAEEVEEEIVLEEVCYLDEISCKIKKVADEYGIDWKLAVAIAKHETQNYTSYSIKTRNNVGGMMYWDATLEKSVQMTFNTLEEGIERFIRNLKNYYIDQGLDTIEKIQPKYAPIGADNDPNGLNNNWVSGVTWYYNSLNGK